MNRWLPNWLVYWLIEFDKRPRVRYLKHVFGVHSWVVGYVDHGSFAEWDHRSWRCAVCGRLGINNPTRSTKVTPQ